ncbi:MAG: hypothetical protein R3338_14370, partial [Thermoanaerobaculia bacterium]|nr:hypothetical protein [Thermoanaerobaculia bacterium]
MELVKIELGRARQVERGVSVTRGSAEVKRGDGAFAHPQMRLPHPPRQVLPRREHPLLELLAQLQVEAIQERSVVHVDRRLQQARVERLDQLGGV